MAVTEPQRRDLLAAKPSVRIAPAERPVGSGRPSAPRHGQGSGDPVVLLRRYQRFAVVGDATSALVAAVISFALRFGTSFEMNYIAFTIGLPIAWVALIAAQRGYERRFLGTGPDEYR